MQADNQYQTMMALFDITENPIQEWIAKQIDESKSASDIFSQHVTNVREMQMVKASDASQSFVIKMVCENVETASAAERIKQITDMGSLHMAFGHILNAYISSVNMVYIASMKARDFECSDSVYDNISCVSFQLNKGTYSFTPVYNSGEEFKSHYVLTIVCRNMQVAEVEHITGIKMISQESEFVNPDIGLTEEDFDSDDNDINYTHSEI